jgi:drug/metabolite transporter (DMT)-like permease
MFIYFFENHMVTEPAPALLESTASKATPEKFGRPAAGGAARPNRIGVVLAFLSIYFIWGSTYLAIRYAVATIPPLYTAGIRHLTAGAILLVWCFHNRLRPTAAQLRAAAIIGALFFLIGHGTVHWAERVVPSGLAALLVAVEPIYVFLLSDLADRRLRFNSSLVAGVLLGLAGVALLFGKGVLTSAPGMAVGAIAILIGAFSWSAGISYSRRSHLSGSPLLLSTLSLLAGSIMLLLTGTIAGEWRGFSLSSVAPRSWMALAYLILFGSVITFTAYNWLLEHFSPTFVATHTYINPIVAVLLGWLWGGESLTRNVVIAATLVIVAVFLVERGMAQLDRRAARVEISQPEGAN